MGTAGADNELSKCEGVDVTVRVMVTEKISRDSLVMMAM